MVTLIIVIVLVAIFLSIGITASYTASMLKNVLDSVGEKMDYDTFRNLLDKKSRHDDIAVVSFGCALIVLLTIIFVGI